MKSSRGILAAMAVIAGPVAVFAVGGATSARADEPCAELKLSGAKVLELPCPEELGRLLDPPPLQSRPDDDGAGTIDPGMAVEPDWPHDQAMVAEHDWPHDRAMVVPRADSPPKAEPALNELMGMLGRFLSRQPRDRPPLSPQPRQAGYSESGE